jgi:hypothetical protein
MNRPIMHTHVDPAGVAADRIRAYNNKRKSLGGSGRPAKWDKLSDAQKETMVKQGR